MDRVVTSSPHILLIELWQQRNVMAPFSQVLQKHNKKNQEIPTLRPDAYGFEWKVQVLFIAEMFNL